MSSEYINKVHKTLADILDKFISVCEYYHLRWCLAYGTLLGAVREAGFISWDHDVDVFMPYEDYRKLYTINKNKKIFCGEYSLYDYDSMGITSRNFKLVKHGTTIATKNSLTGRMFIDIVPIFEVDNSDVTIQNLSDSFSQFKEKSYELFKNGNYKDFRKAVMEFEDEIFFGYNNKNGKNSIGIHNVIGYSYKNLSVSKNHVASNLMPFIDFGSCKYIEIRNTKNKVSIPENYHEVLKVLYGNYMIPVKYPTEWIFDVDKDVSYYRENNKLPEGDFGFSAS